MMLGSNSTLIMRQFEAPRPRDGCTKSISFNDETCARTIRATSIQEVRPMISEIEGIVGGTKAATTSSRKTCGKHRSVSTRRMSRLSTRPP
jgi:hypothetical protein